MAVFLIYEENNQRTFIWQRIGTGQHHAVSWTGNRCPSTDETVRCDFSIDLGANIGRSDHYFGTICVHIAIAMAVGDSIGVSIVSKQIYIY